MTCNTTQDTKNINLFPTYEALVSPLAYKVQGLLPKPLNAVPVSEALCYSQCLQGFIVSNGIMNELLSIVTYSNVNTTVLFDT